MGPWIDMCEELRPKHDLFSCELNLSCQNDSQFKNVQSNTTQKRITYISPMGHMFRLMIYKYT